MKRRTYVLTGDAHCGHLAGLTPPTWWLGEGCKTGQIQRELWSHYARWAEQFKGVDGFIHNGDAIDGKVGTGIVTSDGTWEYKPPCNFDVPLELNVQFLENRCARLGTVMHSKVLQYSILTLDSP